MGREKGQRKGGAKGQRNGVKHKEVRRKEEDMGGEGR
jgi:hypothetical protein